MISFVFADIPEAPYWFPNDLLDWSPETDMGAIYNVSHVKLAKRICGEPIVPTARKDIKVMALSIMNPSTSGMLPQGSNNSLKAYPFTFWQYVDYLVAWAGSAGEGIIVPPSADVIDMAHKNGVPVLGTIFFPPNVYGGRRNWVDQLLQKEGDRFPVADKLIQVAEYYGFDGWFINQETKGCKEEHVKLMVEFIKYIKQKAPWMIIVWYDSMTKDGIVEWQGELNEKNVVFLIDPETKERAADLIFIDFRWQSLKRPETVSNTITAMERYGLKPSEVFMGMDLQANGYYSYHNWPKILNDDGSLKLSLGLYCPSWSYYSSKELSEFWRKEETLWVADHSVLTYVGKEDFESIEWNPDYKQYRWLGIAKFFVEKSPITSLPFITYFNVGHGKYFFVDGKKLSNNPWNNRSLADVFPTYRWLIEGEKNVSIFVDYENAYYGGSSLKILGNISKDKQTDIILYLTDIRLTKDVLLKTAVNYVKGDIDLSLKLDFDDGEIAEIPVLVSPQDWRVTSFLLDRYAGKSIKRIGVSIHGNEDTEYELNLGMIALVSANTKQPVAVKNVVIDEINFKEGIHAEIKLHWDKSKDAEYYEIYRITPEGKKEIVWCSYNNYTYIVDIKRVGKEDETVLQVVPVSKDGQRGSPGEVVLKWPEYPKPKADFESNDTIILPGGKVKFSNKSSEVAEKFIWILPGATPSITTECEPEVGYEREGMFPVILIAENSSGYDIKMIDPMIVVTPKASEIKNLALNKKAYADRYVPTEKPSLAVDGTVENNSKWCATGDPPHWLVIDLGKEVVINKVIIKHAEAGHESPDWNTKKFKIQVSNDGKNWKTVVSVENNTKAVSVHSFAPVVAKYVRLFIEEPTHTGDTAARIYEVEIYGIDSLE
jgi:endo-beta-N-acetylglucosaminidase D/PKD repeat protein